MASTMSTANAAFQRYSAEQYGNGQAQDVPKTGQGSTDNHPTNAPILLRPYEVFKLRKKRRLTQEPQKLIGDGTQENSPSKRTVKKCVPNSGKSLQFKFPTPSPHKSPLRPNSINCIQPPPSPILNRILNKSGSTAKKLKSKEDNLENRRISPANRSRKRLQFSSIDSNSAIVQNEEANLEPPQPLKPHQPAQHGRSPFATSAATTDGQLLKMINENKKDVPTPSVPKSPKLAFTPVDWSLKTKLRFLSKTQFPCRPGHLCSTEEAAGTTGFVRCIHGTLPSSPRVSGTSNLHHSNCKADELEVSPTSLLFGQCLTWVHPNLPGLKPFPRYSGNASGVPSGNKDGFSAPWLRALQTTPGMKDAMYNDWTAALKNLFQLFKAKHAPFFYVCTYNVTALFRATGIAGCDEMHVLLAPTTPTLRDSLKEEGIEFLTPLFDETDEEKQFIFHGDSSQSNLKSKSSGEAEVSETNPNETAESILESLGLSVKDFPSITDVSQNHRLQQRYKSHYNVQFRKKSLVFIRGNMNVQLFVNYLMNTQNIIAAHGPQAGIPPTLLSPVAFIGATLMTMPVKQTHHEVDQAGNQIHQLDIEGPIMPHVIHGLCDLFKITQPGGFRITLTTCESTQQFSEIKKIKGAYPNSSQQTGHSGQKNLVFSASNLKDSGIREDFINEMCSLESQHDGIVKDMIFKEKMITKLVGGQGS